MQTTPKNTQPPKTIKPFNNKEPRDWKKYALYALYACLGYMFLFRPSRTGTIIGTWLHDLVGSFVHAIKF